MNTLIEGAGIFLWPLGFCSVLAVYLITERALALNINRVIPPSVIKAVREGQASSMNSDAAQTLAGRIVLKWKEGAQGEALRSFARGELVRLQRGFFLIDSIVAVAPLLGLLGTVTGLATLFPQHGMPDSQTLTRGVGLALSTTMIGLCIAIPAVVGSNWLGRRLELISSQVDQMVELLERQKR
ncbi:MAG: MotA/TolQ/ExbB proton channel family protein [bacterium]